MRIVLVRHGESEGNVDDKAYADIGDPKIGLTQRGWGQADRAGKFLTDFYSQDRQPGRKVPWPKIWVSSYQRPKETLAGIMNSIDTSIFAGKPEIREDVRLIELNYGILPHIRGEHKSLTKGLRKIFGHVAKLGHESAPFQSAPPSGEAPVQQYNRVDSFVRTLKEEAAEQGHDDILVVSHGHTMRNFLMNWFDLPLSAWDELKNNTHIGNCDAIVIERDDQTGKWTATTVYDGDNGQKVSKNILENIQTRDLEVSDLPEVPAFLKNKPKP